MAERRYIYIWITPVEDPYQGKLVLSWAVGERAVTSLALQAYGRAKLTLIDNGVDLEGFILHLNHDPVFTGYGWAGQLLLVDHVRVSYALNGARDNSEMEGFNSCFKSGNRSLLLDAQTLEGLTALVA